MRIPILLVCVLAAARAAAGQAPADPQTPAAAQVPVSLNGCVSLDQEATRHVTVPTPPTGRSKHRYAGRTLVTSTGSRIRVVGRLIPSTNVAAQIGSIDATVVSIGLVEGGQNRLAIPPRRTPLAPVTTLPRPLYVNCPSQ